jgi:hypothetical protein
VVLAKKTKRTCTWASKVPLIFLPASRVAHKAHTSLADLEGLSVHKFWGQPVQYSDSINGGAASPSWWRIRLHNMRKLGRKKKLFVKHSEVNYRPNPTHVNSNAAETTVQNGRLNLAGNDYSRPSRNAKCMYTETKLNSVALVSERTIPTERPPLVGEVSANFFG